MSEKRLRIGIIGLGRIAMAHVDAAMALKDQVELIAIAELRADRAKEIAEKLGVKNVYSDYHELLGDPQIEAVIVCLPCWLLGTVKVAENFPRASAGLVATGVDSGA